MTDVTATLSMVLQWSMNFWGLVRWRRSLAVGKLVGWLRIARGAGRRGLGSWVRKPVMQASRPA